MKLIETDKHNSCLKVFIAKYLIEFYSGEMRRLDDKKMTD